MKLIELKEVSFTYKNNTHQAVDSVSFTIEQGDYIAILGANGSGKSTLVRMLANLFEPTRGSVIRYSKTYGTVPSALVFQFPADQIIGETIPYDIAFGPENIGIPFAQMHEQIPAVAKEFGFVGQKERQTLSLTTGEKQSLALAGARALDPALLLLDEPTSMLSPVARKNFLNFLDTYNNEGGSLVHVTHELKEAARAKRLIILDDGKLVYDGSPDFLQKMSTEKLAAWGLAGEIERDATFNTANSTGKIYMITGESGAGKSLALETLAGLRETSEGLFIDSKRTRALAVQEIEASLFAEFLVDDIAFGPRNMGLKGKPLLERVKTSMNLVGLNYDEFKERRTFSLSGGEKRKAGLAGILAMDSELILLDEPSSALDGKSRDQLLGLLIALRGQGKTVICTTNREEELLIADEVIKLDALEATYPKDIHTTILKAEHIALELAEKIGFTPVDERVSKKNSELQTVRRLRLGNQGAYTALPTAIHALSPVTKYILAISSIAAAIAVKSLVPLLILILAECIPMTISKYPFKRLVKSFFFVFPWLALFALIQYLINPKDLLSPTLFIVRFVALLIPISTFVHTTSLSEIMYGMEDVLAPLKLLRIPVRDLSLVVALVFRFVELLYEEAARINLARYIRSAKDRPKQKRESLTKKIVVMASLFVPLSIRTLVRAERIAEAMSARYYGHAKNTRFAVWTIRPTEWILRFAFPLVSLAFIATRFLEIL